MRKLFISLLCASALNAAFTGRLQATGGFSPERWLDNGGMASDMSPEFYWELEVKRMARKYTPPEKRVVPDEPKDQPADDGAAAKTRASDFTGQIDATEFEDAIKTGRIKPPDPEKAREAHKTARELVTGGTALPEEFDSEFANYHRGAFAFRNGETQFEEARTAWEALLKRPENERHYRSVWAAFMLGKLALAKEDPAAVKWFREARELAGKGFADALGLAADSYGWEARSELRQQHFEAAAKLYLTQLALGDDSAIVSLKAVIPDRPNVDGVANYGGEGSANYSEEEMKKSGQSRAPMVQKRLEDCARSPVLRQLVTAHVLATETQEALWSYGADDETNAPADDAIKPGARCLRWLATVEKAGLKQLEDADHLGWVAYTAGRYKEAARWLAMAKPETPTALWLKAKLERRDGKIAQATTTMAAALKGIETGVIPFGETMFTQENERGYSPDQSAAGDLAGLRLTRGDFLDAMEAFLQGNLWDDAAFIADRVLTVDELKKYVDAHYPKPAAEPKDPDNPTPADDASRMRWMLTRRLVRANRFAEARPYFHKKEQGNLDRYVDALKEGDNSKLPKMKRAQALFTAAWIARHDGLEIMGTEEEPDGFVNEGNFPPGNLDTERVEGVRTTTAYDDKKQEDVVPKKRVKFSIPATAAEKQRITANSPRPTRRYHYRWVAADLAWRAAGLMSDGTEELADVLNTGGSWIKDHDDKGADKFIQAIERRCPHTDIGKAESVKHRFVDNGGPWSGDLEQKDAAASPNAAKPQ